LVERSGILGYDANFDDRFISDHKILEEKVNHLRGLGSSVVLTMGTFDMVHIGHARYVREARNKGDILIVGVDSDEKVRRRKGDDRPLFPEIERLEMLTHLRYVDIVTIKGVDDPHWKLIKIVKPDVLIATKETYNEDDILKLKKFCGEVCVLEPMATTSTSAKIRKLVVGVLRPAMSRLKEVITEIEHEMDR
jgi:D-glycero-beta-D-manno-heptose 1-phosphate adenylyltransferase